MVPIAVEGGKGANTAARRRSALLSNKPIVRKDSRQQIKSIQVNIQLEAATSEGTKENLFRGKSKLPEINKSDHLNGRKIAIAGKHDHRILSKHDPLPKKSAGDGRRVFTRRQSSSRDLGIDQGSAGIKKLMSRSRRQSSSKDLLGLDQRRKSCGKVVIRRDSVNGLRFVTNREHTEDRSDEEQRDENDAIERLSAISLKEVEEFSKFELDALNGHNKYRKLHGVPPLTLSKDLSDAAEEYANHLARTNTFSHSGDPLYGENLYWSWSSDSGWMLTGDEPVDSWYDERIGYDYGREPGDAETGHFTQLVWAKSLHLGVGVAKSSSSGKYIVVMKYDPAGNYLGQYRDNVARPGGFGEKKRNC